MASSGEADLKKAATSPNLPKGTSVSKGSNKRNADESQGQNSPIRRSKRFKSGEALNSLPQTTKPETRVKREKDTSESRRPSLSKKQQEKTGIPSVKREVKEEQEETELSVNINQKQPEAEPVTGKVSRKRKTKEEKELEMQPLAVRTAGLRMYVGAHVSAAKGQSGSLILDTRQIIDDIQEYSTP